MTEELKKRIDEAIASHRVVIFMKGTPHFPMCGFSRAAVETLQAAGATEVAAFNVLQDPELREGIKVYSNWPTIPQVYIDGKFIGGSDILRELHERGELARLIRG
jgi:monothiol glutaredoxin